MGDQKTYQIRILTKGLMVGLIKKIRDQFINKHGFTPKDQEVCEAIAKAIIDNRLFAK